MNGNAMVSHHKLKARDRQIHT